MTDSAPAPFEAILNLCAQAAPAPWYPRDYAQATGTPRDSLEPYLEKLRLGGLIQLTEWVEGHGQGYRLTPEGERLLNSPRELGRLRVGQLPTPRKAMAMPAAGREFGRTTTWERGEAVREALLNPDPARVTYVLFAANVLVFLYGYFLAYRERQVEDYLGGRAGRILLDIGAVTAEDILEGRWWKLFTACFAHAGLLHICMNMYGLYILGPMTERMFGHARYLTLYLIAGFGGSCAGMLFQPQYALVGASGALCGLLTAMGAWTWLNRQSLPPPTVSKWMRHIAINIVLLALISNLPGVSWSAHVGGAVVGLVAAVLLNFQRFGTTWLRWLALVGVALLPVVCFGMLQRPETFNKRWAAVIDAKERADMDRDYLPQVHKIEQEALAALQDSHALKLIDKPPEQRTEAQVKEAVAALDKAQREVDRAADVLRRAGPFRTPFVEEARQSRLALCEARIKLFAAYQHRLEKGTPWTAEDEKEFDERDKEYREAQKSWRKLVD